MDAISPPGGRPPVPPVAGPASGERAALRSVATEFEAVFLAEMLRHTGLAETRESFGGGVGEQGYAAMLVREYADHIARSGGTGIAEQVYRALAGTRG